MLQESEQSLGKSRRKGAAQRAALVGPAGRGRHARSLAQLDAREQIGEGWSGQSQEVKRSVNQWRSEPRKQTLRTQSSWVQRGRGLCPEICSSHGGMGRT